MICQSQSYNFLLNFSHFINNRFRSIPLLFLRPAPSQHQHESHAEDQLQHRGHRRCKSNVKKGNYVSSHLHLNITYLLEADSEEQVSVKADENSGVMWFSPEDALEKSTEPWFVEHIYSKLIKKMGI